MELYKHHVGVPEEIQVWQTINRLHTRRFKMKLLVPRVKTFEELFARCKEIEEEEEKEEPSDDSEDEHSDETESSRPAKRLATSKDRVATGRTCSLN